MKNLHDSDESLEIPADRLGQLVKLAGRRPVPDAAQMMDARAAAHAEWTRALERRHWRMVFWSLTAAAVALFALGAVAWFVRNPQPVPPIRAEIATVEAVTGPLAVIDATGESRSVATAGARVRTGDRIDTAAATRAALRMSSGVSVRLDRGTSAVVESENRLNLERGAAYVDAQPGASAPLHIVTSLGVVQHTGTQFEVRLDGATLQVRVREGSVAVDASGSRWTSQAGESMVLARGRSPERRRVATSGSSWNWVRDVVPPFQLEGATVAAFLHWVAREEGWTLEFSDAPLRVRVDTIVLHGSVAGLTPEEALAAVLPTCGLRSRLEGDRLIVSAAQQP